jgi:hypothetical protein
MARSVSIPLFLDRSKTRRSAHAGGSAEALGSAICGWRRS